MATISHLDPCMSHKSTNKKVLHKIWITLEVRINSFFAVFFSSVFSFLSQWIALSGYFNAQDAKIAYGSNRSQTMQILDSREYFKNKNLNGSKQGHWEYSTKMH